MTVIVLILIPIIYGVSAQISTTLFILAAISKSPVSLLTVHSTPQSSSAIRLNSGRFHPFMYLSVTVFDLSLQEL